MHETSLLHKVMLACGHGLTRLFRNNVGALPDRNGRVVRYGVCNPGGSDLIGWKSYVIQPQDVGRRVAVFVGLELKAPGSRTDAKREKAQRAFRDSILAAGGIAGKITTVEEAQDALGVPRIMGNKAETIVVDDIDDDDDPHAYR